jgi:DNA modification methylase
VTVTILKGDCLSILPTLEPGSIDMVLADVPYGQTQNGWDVPIPFEPMWRELRRVTKPAAAIVLMAAQPFASKLVCSNLEDFRYDLIWQKNKPTGFLNAKKQPLRNHEHMLMFYRKPPFYLPQMTTGHKPVHAATQTSHGKNYGAKTAPIKSGGSTERYPGSIIPMPIINNDDPEKWHPTQKPVDLFAWLIRSYTAAGQTILDFTAGSGTTAVAAQREGRSAVLIELHSEYAAMAERRIRGDAGMFAEVTT